MADEQLEPIETEEEKKRKKSLAETIKPPAAPAKLLKPEEYIAQMNALNQDPRFNQEASDAQKKTLAEAMRRSEQLYGERSTRNDWLEVAQMLGRAGAQFGAAQAGMKSDDARNMSGLSFIPPVDYTKRTDRAAADYEQQLRNLNTQKQLTDAENKEEYRRAFEPAEQGLRAAIEAQRLKERGADEGRSIANTDYSRAWAALEGQEKDQESREKIEEAKYNSARTLLNRIQDGDAPKEAIKKWATDEPTLAKDNADALNLLRTKLEAADKYFNGKSDEEDAQDRAAAIAEFKQSISAPVKEIRNLLDGLRDRKLQMAAGKITPKQALESQTVVKPATPPGIVRIQAPDNEDGTPGEIREVPADQKDYYVSKGGKVIP